MSTRRTDTCWSKKQQIAGQKIWMQITAAASTFNFLQIGQSD